MITRQLLKAGYQLSQETNVWIHSTFSGITYSDGIETEQHIATIIEQARDITVLSTELRQYCTDWPTLYHLSSTRANILRPFEHDLKGDILEIGAGCGAVTRFLGECGANVLALEGSPRRAAITRSRTRDLSNVTVLAERFDDFRTDHQFDIITLIGVLEYANLFTSDEEPALSMLKHTKTLLKPNGKLIIAIENQLGLKYFAGAPEDHIGQAMYGIEGRYRKDEPQTFGRVTLAKILQEAGFSNCEFWAPFPDYKFPVSIVTEEGFKNKKFDAATFAWQIARRDPQLPPMLAFSPELVWQTVVQNELALDLANSFLVVAGNNRGSILDSSVLAWHFTTERKKEFCKTTCFIQTETDTIEVRYTSLAPSVSQMEAGRLLTFNTQQEDNYISGKLLSQDLIRIITRENWQLDDLCDFLKKYFESIDCIGGFQWDNSQPPGPDTEIPGRFFDCVPQNIIIDTAGIPHFIDTEWECVQPVQIGFLVFRLLILSLGYFARSSSYLTGTEQTYIGLIQAIMNGVGWTVDKNRIIGYSRLEEAIQAEVAGRTLLPREKLGWLQNNIASGMNLNQALNERDKIIADQKEQLTQILGSRSWRITAPLRSAVRMAVHGVTREDRTRMVHGLRQQYHRLPLPPLFKRFVSVSYHKIVASGLRKLHRMRLRNRSFVFPSVGPVSNTDNVPDYIVYGVIDWHFRHQRPQQLARALVDKGRRVFFISPNFIDDERHGFEVEKLDSAGWLFQVNLFVKGAPVIYASAPSAETVAQLRGSIGKILEWADCKQVVSLVEHPFWSETAAVVPNSRLVYDCIDHHEGFENNDNSLLHLEKLLLKNAELTVTTSLWLYDAVTPHARQRVLIRNAGDYPHFSKRPKNIYRDPQGRQIIGYYGAIAEWFDTDLVAALAEQLKQCCIVLIGADTVNAKSQLSRFDNVIFTGEVPYNELPGYLHAFDVCLLPFKVIPLTRATNPVKVYEYLSAGKPVVAVDLPEISQFQDLVYRAGDKESFLSATQAALKKANTEILINKRKHFAESQTWQQRAESLIQNAESFERDPLVSIIVVTYNNIDLTRACLKSLDEHSQYEQMEVIVVDNASRDRTQDFLSDWAARSSMRKLILNDQNLGFAAANNQGLEAASGEYLVLLNNDTHVTPGWIRTLKSHLDLDKTIGLIGPVTNNIGNEAKIDIVYTDMDEMLIESASYTRKHIGELYALRTAAFFCVMMPRKTYEQVGPLDEAFGIGFFEDDDYCRRIEQFGLRIVCAEDVFVHHHLSASFNALKKQERHKLFEENRKIYEAKWGKWTPHTYRQ